MTVDIKKKPNKKSFYNQIVYPTLIMIIFTVVITGAIAVVTEFTKDRIAMQANLRIQKAILNAMHIQTSGKTDIDLVTLYKSQIEEKTLSDRSKLYIGKDQNTVIGYVKEMNGPALWGNVQGFYGVSADFKKLIGIDFVAHSETPGLGGRIDEDWFKTQFIGIELHPDGKTIVIKPADGGNIDGIAGATLTGNAIRDMVNAAVQKDLKIMREEGLQ